MARREAFVTADWEGAGRDKGRVYKITEMPAARGEEWGMQLVLALGHSGVELPPGMMDLGMAAVAYVGIKGLISMDWAEARPLLEQMMACVQAVPDPRNHNLVRPLVDEDVEEVLTRARLRDAVLELHTGFSVVGFLSTLRTSQGTTTEDSPREEGSGASAETSPAPSPMPSPADTRRTRIFKPPSGSKTSTISSRSRR